MTRVEDSEVTGRKRQRRALLRAPFAGACVAAWCAATSAHAIEIQRNADGLPVCIPAARVMAQLKAEGQQIIAAGDRLSSEARTSYSNVITARPDGTLGNILEGDGSQLEGRASTCFSVRNKLTDIKLNDPARTDIPQWAYVNVDPAVAKAALAKDTMGRAGVHNERLNSVYNNGYRVVMNARSYTLDGKTLGPLVTFRVDMNDAQKIAGVDFTRSNGVANTMFNLVGTKLTTALYDQINYRNRVAPK
jgi:hypothetical protein